MHVSPSQFDMLSSLVDAAAVRHQVLSNNIANVNTPGFQRQGVRFEEYLAAGLSSGEADVASMRPQIYWDASAPARMDGNNVDINSEMMEVTKNTLLHNTYLQILNTKIGQMRTAITG